jgi:uncharacterized protein YbjT (DUF2867 family)
MEGTRTAWVAGATGLIGRLLLSELLDSNRYSQVVALLRRPAGIQHPRLVEKIIDFSQVNKQALPPADDAYCALGTTIKKAGSQSKFREVDFQYPMNLARAAKSAGAQQFLLVSSVGANARARNFYLRTKGELEDALVGERFESLHIFRPSILVGTRTDRRPGERFGITLGKMIAPLMVGSLRKYRPIWASTVARAMLRASQEETPGVHVHEFDSIRELADH